MRRILIVVVVLLVLIAGGWLFWSWNDGVGKDQLPEKAKAPSQTVNSPGRQKPHRPATTAGRKQQRPAVKRVKPTRAADEDEEDDNRTPAEKALAERIERALDEEKFEDAVACVKEALKCGDVEIRQSMVDTLGWFGKRALPELTPFMADADEDVRVSAQNEWTMALSDIENDADKISPIEMAMSALTDGDVLEDISSEYIGMDEKLAVESLLRIIEGSGCEQGRSKARETYEFITGEEFTNRAAAEKWIAEEYHPADQE